MDVNELLSNETKKMIKADLQKKVDWEIKNNYPIRVKIGKVSVDPGINIDGGEIEVIIPLPDTLEIITDEQYLAVSDRYQLLVNMDEFYPGEIGEYVKEVYGD